MAGNSSGGLGDDFFEQILAMPSAYSNTEVTGYGRAGAADIGAMPMVLQLGSSVSTDDVSGSGGNGSGLRGMGSIGVGTMPLGLNLEHGFLRHDRDSGGSFKFNDGVTEANNSRHYHPTAHNNSTAIPCSNSAVTVVSERETLRMTNLFPAFTQLHTQSIRPTVPPPPHPPQHQPPFQGQPPSAGQVSTAPQLHGIRPRVRARRGQATDPHSIAERLRRERIAERMKALQELVPSANKTDRAAMLDEIVDYVKFLRLQVKVLSMSRLGGAGAVAQLVADVPLSTIEGDRMEGGTNQPSWEKWSNDGTEEQVAKLMEEDMGAAMQFLQSKALCIMPISLASAIFRTPQSDMSTVIKTESNNHP